MQLPKLLSTFPAILDPSMQNSSNVSGDTEMSCISLIVQDDALNPK